MRLFAELTRRRMWRALASYAVGAFVVLQICEPVVHGLRLPEWAITAVVIVCIAGAPVAFALAWIYDLTPEGIRRTPPLLDDELSRRVAEAVRAALARGPQAANPRAYEHCVRGRQFLRQTRRQSLLFARQMFERAVADDPSYAQGHAGLAEAAALYAMYYPPGDEALDTAEQASARALQLAPDLAEAHAARGLVLSLRKQYAGSEAEFRRAVALDASLFEARYYFARACFQQGRLEDAVRLFREASAVREDYQAAFFAAQAQEALGRDARGAYAEALAVVERWMDFNPDDPRAATMRAVSLCRLGRHAEGLGWAQHAITVEPRDPGVTYNVACLYALEGDSAKAIECIERVFAAGFRNKEWMARDPDLASLRGDPRFEELIA